MACVRFFLCSYGFRSSQDDLYAGFGDSIVPKLDDDKSEVPGSAAPAAAADAPLLPPRMANVGDDGSCAASDGGSKPAFALKLEPPTGGCCGGGGGEMPSLLPSMSYDMPSCCGSTSFCGSSGAGDVPPSAPAPYKQENKLFLGNLGWETVEDGLRQYFGNLGTVLDCMVLRERETQKSRGFGFVTIEEDDAVERILNGEHWLDGRQLNVRRATKKSDGPQPSGARKCLPG